MDLAERFERNRPDCYGTDGCIERLAEDEQTPEVLILTCMDSRANIGRLFALDAGDAMILQSAGPIIPPYDTESSASQLLHENLAMAINDMKVPNLVLLGHTHCATAEKLADNLYGCGDIPVIKKAANQILQATLQNVDEESRETLRKEIEKQIIIQGIKNLFDYPAVIKGIKENRLTVEGLQFQIEEGRLAKLKTDGSQFQLDIVAGPAFGTLGCDCRQGHANDHNPKAIRA